MIPFFDVHPGELLWSALARLAARLGFQSLKLFQSITLGSRNALAVVDLPSNTKALQSALPRASFTAEELIYEHTLYPLYACFLGKARSKRLLQMMIGREGPKVHYSVGISASTMSPPCWMRACPVCFANQRKEFGVPLWLREHQITGINVCPHHKIRLADTDVPRRNRRTRHVFVPASKLPLISIVDASPVEAVVANLALKILETKINFEPDRLNRFFRQAISDKGYLTQTGRIRWTLANEMNSYCTADYLDSIQSNLRQESPGWLATLLRRPYCIQSPVRYLLLFAFLGLKLDDYSSYTPKVAIPAAVVQTLEFGVAVKQGRRHLAWNGTLDRKLKRFWKDLSLSLREIARTMRIDPITAKRRAVYLKLPFPRMGRRITVRVPPRPTPRDLQAEIALRRTKWLSCYHAQKLLTRKGLRVRYPAEYAWLYRHDRAWVLKNQPTACRRRGRPGRMVDWRQRDQELSIKAKEIADLLLREKFPHRITATELARRLGLASTVQKSRSLLPKTTTTLARLAETRTDFALRRICQLKTRRIRLRRDLLDDVKIQKALLKVAA